MRRCGAHPFPVLAMVVGVSLGGGLRAQTAQKRPVVGVSVLSYLPQAKVKGPIELPGTEEFSDVGDEWASGFRKFHPGANLIYRSQPAGRLLKEFLEGSNLLMVTSWAMTPEEINAFQVKFGNLPLRIPICLDANIVFIHKSNPIASISMEQLEAIYSKSRLGGAKAPALVWGDLGLKGTWAQLPIHAYAWAEGTGSRTSFAEKVLLLGDYRPGILERQDPSALAEAVAADPAGIAFGPMSSWYLANKVLPVTPYHGTEALFPNQENITSSRYPMPRMGYAYLNYGPGRPLPEATNEVVHFLMSREGQEALADAGLLPGPEDLLDIELKRLSR